MLFPALIMLLFFVTDNIQRAKNKGLLPTKWGLLTFISAILGFFVGCFVLSLIIFIKYPDLIPMAQANNRENFNTAVLEVFMLHDILYSFIILSGAFGGYLIIRYMLDKRITPSTE